jgi:O-antigen ligase
MKWVVFAAAVFAVLPLTVWLRQSRSVFFYCVTALVALPFVVGIFPRSQIALSGDPLWPGYSLGFEISALDLIAVAVFLASPAKRTTVPFKAAFFLYISAIAISAFHAGSASASLWYLLQCVRIFFFFFVLARISQEERGAEAVMTGLGVGICFEAAIVLWQRFVIHDPHAPGSFFHQNALGFALHSAILVMFALAISNQRSWKYLLMVFLGVVCDVFTASRASLGLIGIGLLALLAASIARRWTQRKSKIIAAVVVGAIILSPVVIRTFEIRAQAFGVESDDGRTAMNDAAAMITSVYPNGIGANNFVLVAQTQGFYSRAGVAYPNFNISPHNAFWTTLAETGYLGLFALLFLIFLPLVTALSCAWRDRKDPRSEILLALAVALLVTMVHSQYEWLLLSSTTQYITATAIALIAGLAHQLGYWSRAAASTQGRV